MNEEINETGFEKSDDAVLFWSSGTTGDPKGIIYDFDLLARMIINENSVFVDSSVELKSTILTTNFYHVGGFTFSLISFEPNSKWSSCYVHVHECIYQFTPMQLPM